MKKTLLAVLAAGALTTGAAWHGLAADSPKADTQKAATISTPITHAIAGGRDSYADVVNVAAPAVVTIRTEGKARMRATMFGQDGQDGQEGQDPEDLLRRFFGDRFGQDQRGQRMPRQQRVPRQRALGSGVIVTSDGYILTNNHVVDGADEIKVELTDDRTLSAKLVGTDKASDLALLKVTAGDLHPIAIGNSENVKVGDVVLAVGNPLGVGQTVTMGIISAKGRSTTVGDGGYEDFLQTDAPINQGNSGGALVNGRAELVGINSQILSTSGGNIGIGFAIPSNMARNVMDQLIASGKVRRGQLGVIVQPVTPEAAKRAGRPDSRGVLVREVVGGGPAERAGVRAGDIITAFNGAPIDEANGLRIQVAGAQPGATATLTFWRDGKEQQASVTLAEMPPPQRRT